MVLVLNTGMVLADAENPPEELSKPSMVVLLSVMVGKDAVREMVVAVGKLNRMRSATPGVKVLDCVIAQRNETPSPVVPLAALVTTYVAEKDRDEKRKKTMRQETKRN